MRILLAIDGSKHSQLAVKYLITHWRFFDVTPTITALFVDPPLMRRVAAALGRADVARYHAENAALALRYTRTTFKRAGIPFEEKELVGEPSESIIKTAKDGKYDLIVMGSHGRGTFRNLLLGSVVTKVLGGCHVPVLIVR
jgi:nucleotide-binding universal stress UspA family protein